MFDRPDVRCSLRDKLRTIIHINGLVHKSQCCDIVHYFVFQLLKLQQDKFIKNIDYVERHVILLQILFNLCVIMNIYFINNVGNKK